MEYMLSVDFGKNFAFAWWCDEKCLYVSSMQVNDNVIPSMLAIHDVMEGMMKRYSPVVVVEKPGRDWAYQWVQYQDMRNLANVNGCDFVEYMTKTIKKTVSGSGNAGKEVMREAVDSALEEKYLYDGELDPRDEHQFDAIAAGICHLIKVGGGQNG